jgi:hypothetical protein
MLMSRPNHLRIARIALTSLALVGMAACSGADIGEQSENATDTFNTPTEHGALEFTASNPAAFTETQRYHAWTFTLSADAEVELRTELFTQNLDSVMYLYKGGPDGWGSFIAKNDDSGGKPESKIARALDAGEYRIKIRAVKKFQTGSFSVVGACTGDGCPSPGGGMCVGEGPMGMPSAGNYGHSCDPIMERLATTPSAPAPAECGAKLEERAVAYYKEYWDGIYGYDELAGEEGVEPYVDVTYKPGAGAIVDVGLGGDEDSMDFVFDPDGNLVFYYQHNQSPDWAWFCPGEAAEEPDEDCFMSILYNNSYDAADVTTGDGSSSVASAEADDLGVAVAASLKQYAVDYAVGEDVALSYEFSLWQASYDDGAEVTVSSADGPEATYLVLGDGQYGLTIAMKTTSEGPPAFVCVEH